MLIFDLMPSEESLDTDLSYWGKNVDHYIHHFSGHLAMWPPNVKQVFDASFLHLKLGFVFACVVMEHDGTIC